MQMVQLSKEKPAIPRVVKMPGLHLGVYSWADHSRGNLRFNLLVGTAEKFKPTMPPGMHSFGRSSARVSVEKIPDFWVPDLHEYLTSSSQQNANPKPLGYITYSFHLREGLKLASADYYYPRFHIGGARARKLPYFMEAMITLHMKTEGFTHISSGTTANGLRTNQLYKVGLPIRKWVPIDQWLSSMLRGIEMTSQQAFSDV
jgi:hypothetical protein